MSNITRAITIGAFSLLMAACGGGGGGGGDDDDASAGSDSPGTGGGQQTGSPQSVANPNALPPQVTNDDAPVVAAPPDTNTPPPTEPAWTITDLTAVMDRGGVPKALNDNGDIVGETTDPDAVKIPSYIRPFVLRSGQSQVTYLGNLGGVYGHTVGINNAGQIAGASFAASANNTHAFSYQNGQMVDIGALIGTEGSWSNAINQTGDIAVQSNDRIYLYSNGTMRLVPGARMDYVSAINDSDQMVGTSSETEVYQTAAYYDGSTTVLLNPLQGDTSSLATGMNNAGTVIGVSYVLGEVKYRSFIYANGTMQEITLPAGTGTSVTAINDAGDIVGWMQTSDGTGRAFLYRGDQMTDLNTLPGVAGSGWTLQSALKINNTGQILVSGSFKGERRYALLTPP